VSQQFYYSASLTLLYEAVFIRLFIKPI